MNNKDHEVQPRQPGGDEVLGKPDLAQCLRVSVGTIDRYRRVEGLPFIKVGRKVLFRRRDFEGWLEKRSENGEGKESAGRGGGRK